MNNNGMITKIWGPPMWISLHTVTFGYPNNPTDEQKIKYKKYFELVGDILPCKYCRESYKEFISSGSTKLTDDVMENRHTLSRWFYDIHERVNKKLGVNYGVSYEDVVNKYEAYRAKCTTDVKATGCVMPLNEKANSYKVAQIKECSILPYDISKRFFIYAIDRGIDLKYIEFTKILNKCINDNTSSTWIKRNNVCKKIIDKMRINGIDSIEQNGKWKGLPSIYEMYLILMLSSNLTKDELLSISSKISSKKNYKLVK